MKSNIEREKGKVFQLAEINFSVDACKEMPLPAKVLMCSPKYYDIVDVKNVHMVGQIGGINKALAWKQWETIKQTYDGMVEQRQLEACLIIDAGENLEDMVFTANQSFPWILNGEKVVIMSKMRFPSRQKEVPYFREFYSKLGYRIEELCEATMFEGMGDTIPHIGKQLLYGGYGHRSDPKAFEEISKILEVPIVLLRLVDERFYHLDTCFLPISEETVLLCPEAFDAEDLQNLGKLFKNIVHIPAKEAEESFALNAHCLSHNMKALIQKGTKVTKEALQKYGYDVLEVDTSEYMKSGGSVFCMKMMLF